MAHDSAVWKGIIRGKTIELEQDPGLPDGQEVTVAVQAVEARSRRLPPGEGIRRSAGGWAEDAEELDKYLEWARHWRKVAQSV